MAYTLEIMTRTHPLDEVVRAIVQLGDRPHVKVYVERRGALYRWSVAVGGGPYPLLRTVCQYLGVSHYFFVVGGMDVDGWCVVIPARGLRPGVDAYGFIDPSPDETMVRARVLHACGLSDGDEPRAR